MNAIGSPLGSDISSYRAANRAFIGGGVLLFAVAATVTIVWCGSMTAMGGMAMPGGWTMSMAWMRMPGQTWPGAAASFLGMWIVMMVAMMLPSLVPMLLRYRSNIDRSGHGRGWATVQVAIGYFSIWTLLGAAVFPIGVALAMVEMQHDAVSRAVPIAAGLVVTMAGMLQLTAWKQRHLHCCRGEREHDRMPSGAHDSPWRHGLRLGVHCVCCCAGQTAMLLVMGVMDLRAMAVVMAAITAERLAPAGTRVARAIGAATVFAGFILTAQALGFA